MTKLLKALAVAGFLLFLPSGAFAHSDLITTEPTDGAVLTQIPENFVVTYNEDLIAEGTFAVLVKDGVGTDLVAKVVGKQVFITMTADLSAGDYAVEYKTVAADGHAQEGVINFTYAIEEAVAISEDENPTVISPLSIEETDIVIEQPDIESTSNFTAVGFGIAVVLLALVLLLRLRIKNKG